METLIDQLNSTPEGIIFSIVLGFLMLSTYNFVQYNKLLENGVTTIFSSFIVGYLYYYVMMLIPINMGMFWDFLGIVLSGITLAYLVARGINTSFASKVIDLLKIRRTTNHIIWTDLIDMQYTMKLEIKMSDGLKYSGYLGITEAYSQTPVVTLYGYRILDSNKTVADYSKVANRFIVLDTRKADSIEIIYGTTSNKTEDYKKFLEKVSNKSYADLVVGNAENQE